jgi:hypothetical protein
MGNSPDGNLSVAYYQDDEDRKYYVDIKTNLVVEIDARSILASISPNAEEKSEDELRTMAEQFAQEIIPNFTDLSKGLSFEGSGKKDNSFFHGGKKSKRDIPCRNFCNLGSTKVVFYLRITAQSNREINARPAAAACPGGASRGQPPIGTPLLAIPSHRAGTGAYSSGGGLSLREHVTSINQMRHTLRGQPAPVRSVGGSGAGFGLRL